MLVEWPKCKALFIEPAQGTHLYVPLASAVPFFHVPLLPGMTQ